LDPSILPSLFISLHLSLLSLSLHYSLVTVPFHPAINTPPDMSNFISGGAVECGPSSTLKDVSSLVERDYGVQRVSKSHCIRFCDCGRQQLV
jgi:hypothetical protein